MPKGGVVDSQVKMKDGGLGSESMRGVSKPGERGWGTEAG